MYNSNIKMSGISDLKYFLIFLKACLSLLNITSVVYVGFFRHKAHGILAPLPVIEPMPPALEGEILTTGLPVQFSCSVVSTSW